MSVEVTRLPNGLTVVTDTHAASRNRLARRLGRLRQPRRAAGRARHFASARAYGVQGHQAPHRAADRRGDRGGRRRPQRRDQRRNHRLFCQRAEGRHAAGGRRAVRHPVRSDFRPDEFKREQNVIVQEIGAAEDTPDDLVFDHLQATAFPDQPIGRSILGTPETVRSFNGQLRAYLARNYRAPDMVVAAAGAVEHDAVVAEVEQRFGQFNGPAAPEPRAGAFRRRHQRGDARPEQVHIALALQGLPLRDRQLFSLQVFTIVLGGGMSSRLFQEVREKRGLCYTISAFHMPYADTGCSASMPAPTPPTQELMRVVVDEIGSRRTLTEAEVNRAKAQIKAGLLMALESSGARAASSPARC